MPRHYRLEYQEAYRQKSKDHCPKHGDGTGPPCYMCRYTSKHRQKRKPTGANKQPWNPDAYVGLLRYALVNDFWTFFLYGFGAQLNPKGQRWIDPAVHKPICDWLGKHGREWLDARLHGTGIEKRLALVIHREVGKTTIGQAYALWLALNDPEMSCAIGSESTRLSYKILAAIKATLDGSDPYALFSKAFGNWSGNARTWAGSQIVHSARRNTARTDPSFFAFAVETSITGSHPDMIVYDDPISYERLETDSNWLATVNSQVDSLIPVVQGDGLTLWLGTRYDDGDHFGTSFTADGVRSLSGLPTDSIVVDPDGAWDVYFLAGRDAAGKPTTERVWPDGRLARYEKKNPLRYAAQVMNDPTLSETNPITREQIGQCKVAKDKVPWTAMRYAFCCDTAFAKPSAKSGRDWSAIVVHGYPRDGSGDVYVCECLGSPIWRAEEFAKRLIAKVQQYRTKGLKVFAISDELEAGGKAGGWNIALKNMFADAGEPFPGGQLVQFDRQIGPRKISRIENAATFWVDGHVRWVEGAPGVNLLLEQIAKIGQMRVNPRTLKDFADAHADAFQPELYTPMRRVDRGRAPYDRGASPVHVDGLDERDFADGEEREWLDANPRPPLRS